MDKAVAVHNTPPVVSFEEPIEGETFEMSDPITFLAIVEDEESSPAELDLEWSSDLAGLLEADAAADADGEATFTTAGLEEGLHTVTLKATDPQGQIGSDYMTVNVESNCLALTDCDHDEDGYTEEEGDCDDNDDDRNPGAAEIYNGVDDDCDDVVDEGTDAYDDDGDGYTELEGDCDDSDIEISPDADEVEDGIDNDCDDAIDEGSDVFDDDGDGFSEADGDCDDGDPDIYPDAEEVPNGVDDDCDGDIDEGSLDFDDDGDGFTESGGDCNDADPEIHPDALELCDEIDNDCDGDLDGDDVDTDADDDGFSVCVDDCDDEDPYIHPDAPEVCDEIDNDCDEEIDAGDSDTDFDADGYSICDAVPDCDDSNAFVFPGAIEVCDLFDVDEDCDGETNEAGAEGSEGFYVDSDGDGYGSSEMGFFCTLPASGYSLNSDDCNDSDSGVSPAASEVCGDGIDNDCTDGIDDDGAIDVSMWYFDGDNDGFGSVFVEGCAPPSSDYIATGGDCDDTDGTVYPGAVEYCDGRKNNCDLDEADGSEAVDRTTWYRDNDGDGYPRSTSSTAACEVPSGYLPATSDWDCDDWDSNINPGEAEVCDPDDVDENCNDEEDEEGADYCMYFTYDGDGDGFGITGDNKCLCEAGDVEGYTVPLEEVADLDNVDCCDSSASTYPDAPGWLSDENSCGNFNKDCRDGEVLELTDVYDGCDLEFDGPLELVCDYNVGWSYDIPDCGEVHYWIYACSSVYVGEDCIDLGWFGEVCEPDYDCEAYWTNKTQRCQ